MLPRVRQSALVLGASHRHAMTVAVIALAGAETGGARRRDEN
jgi:hypothetical protein